MPDSVRPHPWDSPGKNTGVGCLFLLQCIKVKSESEFAQSCLTLRDPMDCSLPGSSIHGIFQARVLKWGAIAFSENEVVKVALIQSDHRPYKKIIFVYSTRHMCWEERPCEDIGREWLSAAKETRPQKPPTLPTLWSWTSRMVRK